MVNLVGYSSVYCRVCWGITAGFFNNEGDGLQPIWRNDRNRGSAFRGTHLPTQSLLILPQIIQIFKQQRVGGISYVLIFLNLFGDVIKMYYFFLKVTKTLIYRINPSSSSYVAVSNFSLTPSWYCR